MSDNVIKSVDGKPLRAIEVGKRVTLKGDENSPVMVVVSGVADQRSGQLMGFACGYFMPAAQPSNANPSRFEKIGDNQMSQWQVIQVAAEALELVPDAPAQKGASLIQ